MPKGRKHMKGGSSRDFFRWIGWEPTGESDSNHNSFYYVLLLFALLGSLAFILPLVEKGSVGSGKA